MGGRQAYTSRHIQSICRGGRDVARFIAIHSSPPEATQDQLFEGAKKVTALLTSGTEWMNSWWIPETEQLFCEWEAPNAEAIRAALEPVKGLFPIEALYEVQWIDPAWYE
jgi:hypothetical protein